MGLKDVVNRYDIFGEPVHSFNINGSYKIGSVAGLFLSIIVITLTLLFAIIKSNHLTTGKNPNISYSEEYDNFGTPEQGMIDINMISAAFYVQDYFTKEAKDDPRFVEWEVNTWTGNETPDQTFGVHKCNEDDFEKFYQPGKTIAKKVEELKKN